LLPICLGFAALCGHAGTREAAKEPPREVLDNLEFFMEYDLIKELDAVEAAVAGSSAPEAGQTVRVATGTAHAAAFSVKTSTATQGRRK
jgi:hypothetical protein